MAAITAAAITAGATVYSVSEQRKAARQANRAAEQAQIDPDDIARRSSEQGLRNLRESIAAEAELMPEQAALRRASLANLAGLAERGEPGAQEQISAIDEQISTGGTAPRSALLSSAIGQAAQDLQAGGQLPASVRAEIARSAMANASRVGGGRLSLGRFILPRNIGVSSLALQTDRLNRASQLGQVEQNLNQTDFENLIRLRSIRDQLGSNAFTRQLQLGGFASGLQRPSVGLNAGDYASLFVQNANNRATAGQQAATLRSQNAQNIAQGAGAIGGLAGAVGNRFFNSSTAPAAATT